LPTISFTLRKDWVFLEAMERKALHKVLEEGTSLLVSLAVKHESPPPRNLLPFLKRYDRRTIAGGLLDTWRSGDLSFVEVKIAGPNHRQARLLDTE
jgi:hypothetical protein